MSDKFEKWFNLNFDIIPKQHKGIAELVWNAALSSLQGDSTCEYAKSIGATEYKCSVKCLHNEYLPKRLFYEEIVEIMEDLKLDSRKAILHDFAHSIMNKMSADNHAAKIAELESKLAEVEKDAELGRLVMSKMKSGNDVPVSRCTITADEIAAIQESKKGGAV